MSSLSERRMNSITKLSSNVQPTLPQAFRGAPPGGGEDRTLSTCQSETAFQNSKGGQLPTMYYLLIREGWQVVFHSGCILFHPSGYEPTDTSVRRKAEMLHLEKPRIVKRAFRYNWRAAEVPHRSLYEDARGWGTSAEAAMGSAASPKPWCLLSSRFRENSLQLFPGYVRQG